VAGGGRWKWRTALILQLFTGFANNFNRFYSLVKPQNRTGQMTKTHQMLPDCKKTERLLELLSGKLSVVFQLLASPRTPTPSSPLFLVTRQTIRRWTASEWRLRYTNRDRANKKTPHKAAKRRHRWCQRITEVRWACQFASFLSDVPDILHAGVPKSTARTRQGAVTDGFSVFLNYEL